MSAVLYIHLNPSFFTGSVVLQDAFITNPPQHSCHKYPLHTNPIIFPQSRVHRGTATTSSLPHHPGTTDSFNCKPLQLNVPQTARTFYKSAPTHNPEKRHATNGFPSNPKQKKQIQHQKHMTHSSHTDSTNLESISQSCAHNSCVYFLPIYRKPVCS